MRDVPDASAREFGRNRPCPDGGNALRAVRLAALVVEPPAAMKNRAMSGLKEQGAIEHIEIIRLNIERYRRLLKTNLDENTRQAVARMLDEFVAKFVAQLASLPTVRRISEYDECRTSTSHDERLDR